ncbi:nucleotidyltransferase domain-containing protein [Ktedonospora formicarum]|uniref:Polymerase nucleotidyl transferase domain-containing protein n=1 Tax=Ktedonospora formicarum TaxID=2778364 RepID=A0A8J3I4B8_9CHLR|nr:nucleotidyltransferase domain-containing protein [Ktedonospora formicarum]GHO49154.1 hypothetical protein KSX_73170 [Ktedonospora formicarum]
MSHHRTLSLQHRTALLKQIATVLEHDERFVAAWLAGSFGRGEQDALSDLDLHVVVAEAYSETLCATPWPYGARTTEERLALFQQFGTPSVLFESHSNNTLGGTFTYVLYQESAINVDWMLIPQQLAHQEHPSLLLFEKVGIPEPPPLEPVPFQRCIEDASLTTGFFWMIAASIIPLLARHDLIGFHNGLLGLQRNVREVRAALQGELLPFQKRPSRLYVTLEEQILALSAVCDEMEALMPQVVAAGGSVPSSPRLAIEMRLAMLS